MQPKSSPTRQPALPSPDGVFIAALQQSQLKFIQTATGAVIRSVSLSRDVIFKCRFMRWASPHENVAAIPQGLCNEKRDEQGSWCNRLLLAYDDNIHVYDVHDPNWSAVIEKASGSLGGIADVCFGFTANELLVFSDFGIKLTIWSLASRSSVEIKDPKYMVQCYSYRPKTGHMAILARPSTQDVLMLLNPRDHTLVKSIEIPAVDAQGVIWSPDGHWLAIRDAASSGHKLLIYTADGHLFKTWPGPEASGHINLGIKRIEWIPSTRQIVIGDCDGKATILGNNTFSPLAIFHHPEIIQESAVKVWQEQMDVSNERSYQLAPQGPANPPTSATMSKSPNPPRGISILTFSADGLLLAVKDDSLPTTVWIWSLHTFTIFAILIHHSPVKRLSWHPEEADLLLIHCAIPEPSVHLWKSSWDAPRIASLPLDARSGKLEASWLRSPQSSHYKIFLCSPLQFSSVLLSNSGQVIIQASNISEGVARLANADAEDMFDEGNSLDLSPIKITQDDTITYEDGDGSLNSGMGNQIIEDTFHYRRFVRANG